MDWSAFRLSLELAFWTCGLLLPVGILVGRALAWRTFPGKVFVEALIALPLVLPPTVLGFYLLIGFGKASWAGQAYEAVIGEPLVFSFAGLVIASMIFNLPFVVQPMQRAFAAVDPTIREAAWCCGLSRWRAFLRIEAPLAWPGILSALVLTFAHTLGEFGVVLMVGGNIPDETRTVAIAIYDRVQAFDDQAAGAMAAVLLLFSFAAIGLVNLLSLRVGRRHA
ncbi:MAG TPA: molybdate ABC transporter permease subunit [Alphaproteobacteria bacterium]|nr:molybdate ABC transporter permease subunit [Alphaproteobacteria bacterium]